jgi:hypothetical protein
MLSGKVTLPEARRRWQQMFLLSASIGVNLRLILAKVEVIAVLEE